MTVQELRLGIKSLSLSLTIHRAVCARLVVIKMCLGLGRRRFQLVSVCLVVFGEGKEALLIFKMSK